MPPIPCIGDLHFPCKYSGRLCIESILHIILIRCDDNLCLFSTQQKYGLKAYLELSKYLSTAMNIFK